MAVDKAGDQQLALGIDETGVGRFPLGRFGDPNFAVANLAGRVHRGNAVALNDDVPRRRLMDVKVAIKYAGAADQCHRIGGAERRLRSPIVGDQSGEPDERSIWSSRSDRT